MNKVLTLISLYHEYVNYKKIFYFIFLFSMFYVLVFYFWYIQ